MNQLLYAARSKGLETLESRVKANLREYKKDIHKVVSAAIAAKRVDVLDFVWNNKIYAK